MSVRILGIDSGWCNTGLALVEWDGTTARLVEHHTVTTKPTAKKHRLRVVDDHLRRARELWHGIRERLDPCCVDVVAVEALSLARNAGSAVRQAMAYAVVICACEDAGQPVVQFTPQQIRTRLGCPARGDKESVWRAAYETAGYSGRTPWCDGGTEHSADAYCAALAAIYPQPVDVVREQSAKVEGRP